MVFSVNSTPSNTALPSFTSAVYSLPLTFNTAVPFCTGSPFWSTISAVISFLSPTVPETSSLVVVVFNGKMFNLESASEER